MRLEQKFLKIVETYPNSVALASEEEGMMSYIQLNEYANYIAKQILSYCDESVELVGVCMKRSFRLIAVILGILKAGKGYVPLDYEYPINRINNMVLKAKLNVLVSDNELQNIERDILQIKLQDKIIYHKEFQCQNYINETACLIFTSGSTGTPDCVELTHSSVMNTLNWAIRFYNLSAKDKSLQVPSCSFTSSVQDIFSTLLSGGTLIMIKQSDLKDMKELNRIAQKYAVTHFDMVPSLYRQFLKKANLDSLRFVLLAGERLDVDIIKKHYTKFPKVQIVNEYGMAETSSCFSFYKVNSECEKVYIGKPIDNMSYIIYNKDEKGIGELWITGPGLATGYYNDMKHTNEKFIVYQGNRYLMTGDYVCEADGNILDYIGRRDNQIKVNGKRLDLNEIDAFLQNSFIVDKCISTGIEVGGKKRIVTFYIGNKDEKIIEQIIYDNFPAFYKPDYIVKKKDFIYLPNNKVNIKYMKQQFVKELETSKEEINRNAKLIQLIEKYITVPAEYTVSYDLRDEFDSLTLVQLLIDIESDFGVEISYNDIIDIECLSISELERLINKKRPSINV